MALAHQFIKPVTIIIPVFNNLKLTKNCIKALFSVTSMDLFDLIIINNGSSDGTKEFLHEIANKFTNTFVINNEENLGFAKACNQGARLAKTKYLVFLNNDTIPLKGWLEELISTVEEDKTIGVVGSKLLYPDNTIQHAGVVIAQYPSPVSVAHIFKGLPSDFPPANVKKDYQIVTGACMLVRRKIFHDLGGFDESFINGFEDVDFCLRVREAGLRVVYNPKSELYHLESKTEGRFLHDIQNGRVLYNKWHKKITSDPEVVTPLVHILIVNSGTLNDLRICLKAIKENITYKNRKTLTLTLEQNFIKLKNLLYRHPNHEQFEPSLLDHIITMSNGKDVKNFDISNAIDYALNDRADYIWILPDKAKIEYNILAKLLYLTYKHEQIGICLIKLENGYQLTFEEENLFKGLVILNNLQSIDEYLTKDISEYSLFLSTQALLKAKVPPNALKLPSGVGELLLCLLKNGWLGATL